MNIILLGAPGSGKGTLAKMINRGFGATHLSTAELLRNERKVGTKLAEAISTLIDAGNFVPDNMMFELLNNHLMTYAHNYGVILDGFPRTLSQTPYIEKLWDHIDYVVNITVPFVVLKQRLLNRGRIDDTPEIIQKRFDTFIETTYPLVKHYTSIGRLVEVHGNCSIPNLYLNYLEAALKWHHNLTNYW